MEAWAILPDCLAHLDRTEARGLSITRPAAPQVSVYDGVAVIPLSGVLVKSPNIMTMIFGGTTYSDFVGALATAYGDPSIKAALIEIDSPGGTVAGVQSAMNAVRNFKAQKPVAVLADGMMASAAYWIGSAADTVRVIDRTTTVGSIGVVAKHVDMSGAEAARGIRTTEIYQGKYKVAGSPHKPLDNEGRETLQAQIDAMYRVFVQDVAKNRSIGESAALQMADGRLFIGEQAVTAGLADGVTSRAALMAELRAGRPTKKPRAAGSPPAGAVFQAPAARSAPTDMAQAALEYSRRHGVSLAQALDQVSALFRPLPRGRVDPDRMAHLNRARAYALQHGVSLQVAAQKTENRA